MKGNYIHHTSGRSPKVGGNTLLHAVSFTPSINLPTHSLLILSRSTTTGTRTLAMPSRSAPAPPSSPKATSSRTSRTRLMQVPAAARSSLPATVALPARLAWAVLARSTLSAALVASTALALPTSLPTIGDPIQQKYRPGKHNMLQVEMYLNIQHALITMPAGFLSHSTANPTSSSSIETSVDGTGACLLLHVSQLQLHIRLHDFFMGTWILSFATIL